MLCLTVSLPVLASFGDNYYVFKYPAARIILAHGRIKQNIRLRKEMLAYVQLNILLTMDCH